MIFVLADNIFISIDMLVEYGAGIMGMRNEY